MGVCGGVGGGGGGGLGNPSRSTLFFLITAGTDTSLRKQSLIMLRRFIESFIQLHFYFFELLKA